MLPVDGPGEVRTVATMPEAIDRPAPGRPTAPGWRSPAAPATPATRPRTRAGSRRAGSRRSSPGSTARAGSSTARRTCTSSPPTAPAPLRNLTPGPFQHDGVAWLADSSGVVTSAAAPRRLGPRPRQRPLRRAARRRRSAPSPSRPATTRFPAVSPDGTTRRLPRRRRPVLDPQNAKVGVDRDRRRRPPLDLRGARPHVRADGRRPPAGVARRRDARSPRPRTAARPTCYRIAVDGARARAAHHGPASRAGLRRPRRAHRHGPGDRRAPGRDRHARRSGHHASRATLLGWEKFAVPTTDGIGRDRRLDHAPGRVRGPPQVPGAAQRPRRPVHAVRRDVLRRGPDAGRGRVRRGDVATRAAAAAGTPRGGRRSTGPSTRPVPGTGWGSVDVDDVLAVLDHALDRYRVLRPRPGRHARRQLRRLHGDAARRPATATGSGRSARERAVNNLLSEEWSSDIGTVFRVDPRPDLPRGSRRVRPDVADPLTSATSTCRC